MFESELKRTHRWAFMAYRSISRLYFHMPILFVYFYQATESVAATMFLLAVYSVAIALCSPWSVPLARRWGLKGVLMLAEACKATGLFLLVVPDAPLVWIVGQVLGGLGFGLGIGTDSALLRAQIGPRGQEEYRQLEARSMAVMFPSVYIAGVVGAWLFEIAEPWPFLGGAAAAVVAGIAILCFEDRSSAAMRGGASAGAEADGAASVPSDLAFWLLYYVLTRAIVLAVFLGLFPLTLLQIPGLAVGSFGLLLGIFSLCAAASARCAPRLMGRFPEGMLVLTLNAALALSLGLHYVADTVALAVVSIALLGVTAGTVRPVVLGRVNAGCSDPGQSNRLLSRMESLYGFTNAALLVCIGLLAYAVGDVTWALPMFIAVILVMSFLQLFLAPSRGRSIAKGDTP